jgi:hypothetical protein
LRHIARTEVEPVRCGHRPACGVAIANRVAGFIQFQVYSLRLALPPFPTFSPYACSSPPSLVADSHVAELSRRIALSLAVSRTLPRSAMSARVETVFELSTITNALETKLQCVQDLDNEAEIYSVQHRLNVERLPVPIHITKRYIAYIL